MLMQFEEIKITKTIIFDPNIVNKLKRTFHPQDLFWLCECLHLNTGHHFCKGKCYYQDCKCQQFVSKEFFISLEITNIDIFRQENPDLIYDSPTFWVEFEKWEKEKNGQT